MLVVSLENAIEGAVLIINASTRSDDVAQGYTSTRFTILRPSWCQTVQDTYIKHMSNLLILDLNVSQVKHESTM